MTASLRWRAPEPVKQLPFATFLPLLRAGVDAAPHRVDLQLKLARTLFHTDAMPELIDRFQPALAADTADPELLFYLGRAALTTGEAQLAFDALAASAGGGFLDAFGYLADALNRLDRPDQALDAALRGLEHSPFDYKALAIAATVLLDRGEAEQLWDLCTGLRRRGAWGSYVPSVMALAATSPEQIAEVGTLIDPSRWFLEKRLPVTGDFNRRLAAELLAEKSATTLPLTKATSGSGTRVGQLELVGGPAAQELLSHIRAAVEAYVEERTAIAAHPMIAYRPASVALNSWALKVHHDGHETWHLHPAGWISGVYYVEFPRIERSEDGHPGAIEFGSNPFGRKRTDSAWPSWHVTPEPGLLLLFPSYYAHRTWPTGVDDPRICVAFDVMPDEPGLAGTNLKL